MILYTIYKGVITAESVLKETKCGWRRHSNGFCNRNALRSNIVMIESHYHTTDINEALEWQKRIVSHMLDVIQVCHASKSDIEFWIETGSDESYLPESRFVTYE